MKDFDAKTSQFSAANALWLGKAADLAYQDRASVERTLKSWGLRGRFLDAVDLAKGDTQAFVASDAATMIIAFRGTKDPLDFLTDAQFMQAGFNPAGVVKGMVHRGFLHALDVAWPAAKQAIADLRDAAQPIWVTGHSLGAALATLAVARLAVDGVAVSGLYTFGSPAVGDTTFAASFDAAAKTRTFRFVNDLDIVTRCPPEGVPVLPPYRHVGTRKLFDAKGALSEREDKLRWLTVAAAVAEIAARSRTLPREQLKAEIREHVKEPLDDHAMAGYVKNLTTALAVPPSATTTTGGPDPSGLAAVVGAFRHLWGK